MKHFCMKIIFFLYFFEVIHKYHSFSMEYYISARKKFKPIALRKQVIQIRILSMNENTDLTKMKR